MSTSNLIEFHPSIVQDSRPAGSDPLSRLLHPAQRPDVLDRETLATVAEGLARGVRGTRINLSGTGHRSYRRLVRTEQLEAWLIAWHSGAFLELHDHGGSNGALALISGGLLESYSDLLTRDVLTTIELQAGESRHFGATHVHEVWNPHRDTALSVHAYSPPLTSMSFYGHGADDFLQRLRTETDEYGLDAKNL